MKRKLFTDNAHTAVPLKYEVTSVSNDKLQNLLQPFYIMAGRNR